MFLIRVLQLLAVGQGVRPESSWFDDKVGDDGSSAATEPQEPPPNWPQALASLGQEADDLVSWDGAVHPNLVVSPGTIAGTASGWSKSASSSRSITVAGDAIGISFRATAATSHFLIGWTSLDTTATSSYKALDFGISLRGEWRASTPEVYERGSAKFKGKLAHDGNAPDDVWSIEVNAAGTVDYKRNGIVFYTSERVVAYPWHAFIDVFTSASPSTVSDVKYVYPEEAPAQVPIAVGDLVSWDGAVHPDITASLGTIAGTASGWSESASSSHIIASADDAIGISFRACSPDSHFLIGWTLDDTTATSSYKALDFGITLRGEWRASTPEVYERGTPKFTGILANDGNPPHDVWSIELNAAGSVDYKFNGIAFYTSTRVVQYPWHAFIDVYTSASPSTVCDVRYVRLDAPAVPEVPITDGDFVDWDGAVHPLLTVSPGTIAGTASGWSKSASASRMITDADDAIGISFRATTKTSHVLIGWTSLDTTATSSYTALDYGITLRGKWRASTPEIYERGTNKYAGILATDGNPPHDVWSIEVNEAGTVDYKCNGIVFYTSERAVQYPWHAFIDVFTSASPSTVNDVKYVYKEAAVDKFTKLAGQNCAADGDDLLRDFEGTAEQCAGKAIEIGADTFIRVNGGSNAHHVGKCYFRGGNGGAVTDSSQRDCYKITPGLGAVRPLASQM